MSQEVTIRFNIEEPIELKAAMRALKATDAYLVLYNLREELIESIHGEMSSLAESVQAEAWLTKLNDLSIKYNINLEEELN